jgi:hypothetical protein
MRPIKVTVQRVGRGFKFVVEDANFVQYEQYVEDEGVLYSVAVWLKKRDFKSVEDALTWLDYKIGNIFTYKCSLEQFLDACPLSGLNEVCDPVERRW